MTGCIATQPAAAIGATAHELPAVATGLVKMIDERTVLDDVTFRIPAGRFTALLGANGAGKSTLLRILATLVAPTRGELRLFGRATKADLAGVRERLGMIAHGSMLYHDLTAFENLALFGRLYRLPRPADRAREMLALVGLDDRGDDAVKTFSRGMVQRAAIARALMHDPDLLLADEPFAGLDPPSRHALEHLLDGLRRQGKTIILASHDIDLALTLSEHVLVLRHGRLVLDRSRIGLGSDEILAEVTGP